MEAASELGSVSAFGQSGKRADHSAPIVSLFFDLCRFFENTISCDFLPFILSLTKSRNRLFHSDLRHAKATLFDPFCHPLFRKSDKMNFAEFFGVLTSNGVVDDARWLSWRVLHP